MAYYPPNLMQFKATYTPRIYTPATPLAWLKGVKRMVGGYFNEVYLDDLRQYADPYTRAKMLGWEPIASESDSRRIVWRAPNGCVYGDISNFTYEDLIKALDDKFFSQP